MSERDSFPTFHPTAGKFTVGETIEGGGERYTIIATPEHSAVFDAEDIEAPRDDNK